jgi:hypothetical protein
MVLDSDPQMGSNQFGGFDLVALVRLETTGPVQLHEAPSPQRNALRTCSVDDEVIGDLLVGRGYIVEAVDDLEHSVALSAFSEPGCGDTAGVITGRRQLIG